MQVLQRGIFNLVDTLNLTDQQLRIADQFQRLGTVLQSIFERRDQSLILGEVVRLAPEIFAERSYFAARLVLDDYSIASGPGIASSPPIAVRDQVFCRRILSFIEQTCRIAGGV